ncbi:P-loop NTPase family protein [Robiginitalea sediminis]|uniref:hypothetical protein n=1 Tax=Robiginitalea sediminis TaxID=1982593 RepID=UPI000B4B651D|nr:hypothetical protein [Robiginitalea sediminis]
MENIKKSAISKGIDCSRIDTTLVHDYVPKLGDMAVFEVLELGKHKTIQSGNGRHIYIFPGDRILMAFGNRYATNQFEGYVPKTAGTFFQIIGQGGVVGVLKSMHSRYEDIGATQVRLLGYAVDAEGRVQNSRYKLRSRKPFKESELPQLPIYLSLGASMDSGKTTTAAFFCRSLKLEGKRVAYIKLTGTVHSKDRCLVKDCGAAISVDFSLCGYPATYLCSTSEILDIYATLLHEVMQASPDAVVVEIADGLVQKETHALLNHRGFMNSVSGVVLSCPDSLSVKGGLQSLHEASITPMFLSGLFTASPLMADEVRSLTPIPVFGIEDFTENHAMVMAQTSNFLTTKSIAI